MQPSRKANSWLQYIQVSAGLKKLRLDERFRPEERVLSKEQVGEFLCLLGVETRTNSSKSRSERLHDFLADSTQDEIEAWWMDVDWHVEAELRRPAGVAASLARVRALFAACAQRRPSEIDEVFPSSSGGGAGGDTFTLGTWMRMVGTRLLLSFPRHRLNPSQQRVSLPGSGWGSLPQASVAEQSDAYEAAQAIREKVVQRALNISRSRTNAGNTIRRHHHTRAQR